MAHTDTVNVDVAKWTFPPFSATRDGGYVYGRGTVDDKDNVAAALMTMLLLKRTSTPLDRDVIFLAEAGEEGTTRVGIQLMVNQHFAEIDAEYCLAEGGNVTRVGGEVKYSQVQTLEKIPRAIELVARGPAGHGSVPLKTNAIVRLATALGRVESWRGPLRVNETTAAYFKRLASISPPEQAKHYLAATSLDPKVTATAYDYFMEHSPRHASMLRTSLSPNIIQAGYRVNVIPSEAKAMLDVRLLPDEDPETFLKTIQGVVNDPAVEVRYAARDVRPGTPMARLESEAFRAIEADHLAHDEHRGDRHVVPACQRHSVLRPGAGHRRGRRTERFRRAQRSGTNPRERAPSLRAVSLGARARSHAGSIALHEDQMARSHCRTRG
jgi:acetylornithine deacetylase/succinyl-diaminopimelate desuccinylase-like protein